LDDMYWIALALSIPRRVILGTIRFYQKTFSPDHGLGKVLYPHGYCKYHPSCSEYAHRAVDEFGIIRGLVMGCGRIFRCNPWSKGGYDPVKKRK